MASSWTSDAPWPARRSYLDAAITAATRDRILAQAGALIFSRGIDATTVDAICQASGASKWQFYQYFSDKEDFVRSVLDGRVRALLSDQRQQLADVHTMAGLDTWRNNLITANRQRGEAFGCLLDIMVTQLVDRDERARIQVSGYFAEWRSLIATALRRIQTGGQLRRSADPDELATGLVAALQGGCVLALASHNINDIATAIDMALARVRSLAEHH